MSNEAVLLAISSDEFAMNTNWLSSFFLLGIDDLTIILATDAEIKQQGEGVLLEYGRMTTLWGDVLLFFSEKGICYLGFTDGDPDVLLQEVRLIWKKATLQENQKHVDEYYLPWFSKKELLSRHKSKESLKIWLWGTEFQQQVWFGLMHLPFGSRISYSRLARLIDKPTAVRAVASAVAANPVSLIIPCHRIIRNDGSIGQYHWGSARKLAILNWEQKMITPLTDITTRCF